MGEFSIRFEGIENLIRRLQGLPSIAQEALGNGLYDEGLRIMAASNRRVPFELGNLASTGIVAEPVHKGTLVEVGMGYGNTAGPYGYDKKGRPTSGYAVIQHERMDLAHAPGRTAKYLEGPVLERANTLPRTLSRSIASRFAQGMG